MSALPRIAYYQNRRDEVPDQELAARKAAVNARNKQQFVAVLEKRLADLKGSQAARVKMVIKEAEQR